MPRLTGILLLAVALCAAARTAQAAEIGHFNGGILNIRDYFVPEPGLYGGLYNYFYHTGRLNDRHGDAIHSVTINPRGGRGGTVGVDVDVDVDGTVQETVEGDDFARAFLAIWRGAKPPNPGVKARRSAAPAAKDSCVLTHACAQQLLCQWCAGRALQVEETCRLHAHTRSCSSG